MDNNSRLAANLAAYMEHLGYRVDRGPGEINIAYLEGADADGRNNADRLDEWNDRRILFTFDSDGQARILLNAVATTEPGGSATYSASARKRGGVARIKFGQYRAWRMGYHQRRQTHPALVQVAPLPVHRDLNRDGKRIGDRVDEGLHGINQHGTRPGAQAQTVGNWSEGCLVGRDWKEHLDFIDLLRTDVRYRQDDQYLFVTTVMAGDDFARFVFQLNPPV